MMAKSPKLIWGIVAIGIYIFVVGILIFYFNLREEKKPKNYVKKNEHRIKVALSTPKKIKTVKQKSKVVPKPSKKPKSKKPPKIKKDTKKKVIKEKVVKKISKKKQDENITRVKKPLKIIKKKKKENQKTVDLFSNINIKKKKLDIKVTDIPMKKKNTLIHITEASPSALERINQSVRDQKNMDKGVENAYFAKVQAILETWPARSDFLGEEATVTLFIKPTGRFEYQVTSGSNNEDFGRSVVDFLNQLQGIGFGRHNAGRTYEFEVEFSTKE